MAPVEVEFEGSWARKVKPEKRKTTVKAGKNQFFYPNKTTTLQVACRVKMKVE